jgi:hypothetical protein
MRLPVLVAAVIVIAAGIAATQFLTDVYPKAATKREALNLCVLADPTFNRLDPAARDSRYQHAFSAPALPGTLALTASIPPNEVDLKQAPSQTGAPRNDIRVLQRSNGALR